MIERDLSQILLLAEAVHLESPHLRTFLFDASHTYRMACDIVKQPNSMFIAAKIGHEIIGFMIAFLAPGWTTPVMTATEGVLYVKPEYRGSRCALMLVREFENRARGIDKVVGSSLNICDEAVVNFYQRLGYRSAGFSLRKR